MSSPILPLRSAILARCGADAPLAALLGGTGAIHDEPPPGAEPVYAVFGEAEARDASSSAERGHEQDLAIRIWARPGSTASALAAAERMAELLDDASLALTGHRLVALRVTAIEIGREERTNLARAVLRLRAVTEVT
ncbi:tail completion protein gp17 [Enterovirga aerilata]|uniref:DUF3168 domain-containing protein n=1 Tax=Enterovirga aerilata TaxID=2730920 RepID=A0A849I995_9HYPH|nr:DUF3168 domain-containing protein [Enterovirga sp. DB1703]